MRFVLFHGRGGSRNNFCLQKKKLNYKTPELMFTGVYLLFGFVWWLLFQVIQKNWKKGKKIHYITSRNYTVAIIFDLPLVSRIGERLAAIREQQKALHYQLLQEFQTKWNNPQEPQGEEQQQPRTESRQTITLRNLPPR